MPTMQPTLPSVSPSVRSVLSSFVRDCGGALPSLHDANAWASADLAALAAECAAVVEACRAELAKRSKVADAMAKDAKRIADAAASGKSSAGAYWAGRRMRQLPCR